MENASDYFVREDTGTTYSEPGVLHREAAGELSSKATNKIDESPTSRLGDFVDQYMDMLRQRLGLDESTGSLSRFSSGAAEESNDSLNPVLNRAVRTAESADTIALEKKLSKDIADLSDSEKVQFQANLRTFLNRAQKQGLDEKAETDATLKCCDRLLNPSEDELFLDGLYGKDQGKHLRTMLAEQIMSEAAYPSNTDQGAFGTCPAASMETRTWFDRPAVAAKIIADEALTGEWVAKDGNVVRLPEIDFTPDKYSKDTVPKDGMRSYAGQIFQATVLSDVGTRQSTPEYYVTEGIQKDQNGRYVGVEYWADANGNKIEEYSGLTDAPIARELARLDGPNTEVLTSDASSSESGANVVVFNSKDDLRQKLTEAQESGKMPIIIAVAASDKFFGQNNSAEIPEYGSLTASDPRTGLAWSHALNHVICIDKYDPETDTVVVDNQWGSGFDWGPKSVLGAASDKHHSASLDDFFPATQGEAGADNTLRL